MSETPPSAAETRWRALSERLQARRRALEAAELLLEQEAVAAGVTRPASGVASVVPSPSPVPTEDVSVSYGMRLAAAWSWRLIVVAVAAAAIIWAVWEVRLVTLPVIAATLLAALLHPLVDRLRKAGWSAGVSAGTVFVSFLIVVIGVLSLAGRSFGGQFGEIADQSAAGVDEVRAWLSEGPLNISEQQLEDWFGRLGELVSENSETITSGAISTATIAAEVVTGIVLALFTLFFFLFDGANIWSWTVGLLPRPAEAKADAAGRLAWVTLTGYIRGTMLIALFDGVFITIILLILQVPLAVPLGVLVFFGAFIPVVGAFVTGALAVLVALVTVNPFTALLVFGGIVAVQQLEAHVFQPFVLGRLVRLHPLAVVLSIAVGALVAGIAGALVSVPLVAVLNTIGTYLAGGLDTPAGSGEPVEPSEESTESGDHPAVPADDTSVGVTMGESPT